MLIDDLVRENSIAYADFGQAVTYTPSDTDIDPFSIQAIVDPARYDELEPRFVRDVCKCRILQVELQSHGIESPMVRSQKSQGDTIDIPDPSGTSVTWAIVDMMFDHGEWLLTLERNVRIAA